MTLRRRILLFYSLTLSFSLVIVGYWSWFEFEEQQKIIVLGGVQAALKESPLHEALEIILFGGIPAILIGVIGGAWLMRRALRPIEDLTRVLEKTDVSNLADPVPRSGNGDELDRMTAVFNHMKDRLGNVVGREAGIKNALGIHQVLPLTLFDRQQHSRKLSGVLANDSDASGAVDDRAGQTRARDAGWLHH